jgi:hypothetical protein
VAIFWPADGVLRKLPLDEFVEMDSIRCKPSLLEIYLRAETL